MKNLKFLSVLFALLVVGLTSCGDDLTQSELSDSEIVEVENFVDGAIAAMQDRVAAGRNGCVEFVFPITVSFADGTTATAEDYETLHAAIKAWKEANLEEDGERGRKPDLVFPLQVVNEEGEIIDISTQDELKAVYQECGGRFGNGKGGKRGHRGKGYACFSLVYPVSIDFADGTSETFDDRDAMKDAIKAYKEANGRDAERPTLAFPVTVEYDDGTQATVESRDALKELKQACSEEG